jgi:Transcription factor Tfb4
MLQISEDDTADYDNIINALFECQRQKISIDSMYIGSKENSVTALSDTPPANIVLH